jgi:hypothetical protein
VSETEGKFVRRSCLVKFATRFDRLSFTEAFGVSGPLLGIETLSEERPSLQGHRAAVASVTGLRYPVDWHNRAVDHFMLIQSASFIETGHAMADFVP